MILPGRLKVALNSLFHFKTKRLDTIPERAVREQQALHDLGRSPQFGALLDQFEAEIRTHFRAFSETDDWEVAQAAWRDARATQRLLKRTMDSVGAKQRGEELEALSKRQVSLMQADAERFQAAVDLTNPRGSTPSHD